MRGASRHCAPPPVTPPRTRAENRLHHLVQGRGAAHLPMALMTEIAAPAFVDGFGRRQMALDPASGDRLEQLVFHPALADLDGFEAALRERAARLGALRLTSYARVRGVERHPASGLMLVSEHVGGWRLADLLDVADSEG
jgi:hypothetical protein